MKKSIFTLISIILISITTNVSHAGNYLRIPDEFMIKLDPRNVDFFNTSQLRTVEDINNTCLATTPSGSRFEYRTCDSGDLTQHFRYENNSLINFQNDCLTLGNQLFISNVGTGLEICDEATQRLNTYDQIFSTNVFFRSCNNTANQRFDINLNNDSISFTQNDLCLGALGMRSGAEGICFPVRSCSDPNDLRTCAIIDGIEYDFSYDNLEVILNDSFCASSRRASEFDLASPGGGSLIIEKLIPIVIPL